MIKTVIKKSYSVESKLFCLNSHILIVDDDEFNIYTLQKLLTRVGID